MGRDNVDAKNGNLNCWIFHSKEVVLLLYVIHLLSEHLQRKIFIYGTGNNPDKHFRLCSVEL